MNREHALLRAWTAPTSARDRSPLATLFELTITDVDHVTGRATTRFTVPTTMRDATGAVSGRAVVAMLDCAPGFAALAVLEPPEAIVTATLRIESVAGTSTPVLEARGILVARNASTLFTRATLHDGADRLVELASATLRLVTVPR